MLGNHIEFWILKPVSHVQGKCPTLCPISLPPQMKPLRSWRDNIADKADVLYEANPCWVSDTAWSHCIASLGSCVNHGHVLQGGIPRSLEHCIEDPKTKAKANSWGQKRDRTSWWLESARIMMNELQRTTGRHQGRYADSRLLSSSDYMFWWGWSWADWKQQCQTFSQEALLPHYCNGSVGQCCLILLYPVIG